MNEQKKIFNEQENLIVPDYVITEVMSILKMKESLKRAEECMFFLRNSVGIDIYMIDMDTFDATAEYFLKHSNNLSFIDAFLVIFSEKKAMPLMTFDRELAKLAKGKNRA